MKALTAPVTLIVFNRPDLTARVWSMIRQARPSQLFIIADGARSNHPTDAERCQKVREICDRVDWDCEVKRNYADVNLGCRNRVTSGLNWVFEQVEASIILEDDCLPDLTFFPFCQELLEKYRDDQRIMGITGNNYQFGRKRSDYSYYFSIYALVWGWATWRRAWQHFDVDMSLFPAFDQEDRLEDILQSLKTKKIIKKYWHHMFKHTHAGAINTWAYPWFFTCLTQSGLTIAPNVNLVSNIGFGADATNHHNSSSLHIANLPTVPLSLPLVHPPFLIQDTEADNRMTGIFKPSLITKIKNKVRSRLEQDKKY